jgi:hypothetical protein
MGWGVGMGDQIRAGVASEGAMARFGGMVETTSEEVAAMAHEEEETTTGVEPRACRGTKTNGEPCGAPPELVSEAGWCSSHDPDPVMQERLALARVRGGLASTKNRPQRPLTDEELGPLETAHDARRWAVVVAKAAATGRISPAQASAATRAVDQFLKALDTVGSRELVAQLAALTPRLDQLEKAVAEDEKRNGRARL